MKKLITMGILAVLVIGMVLTSGCTGRNTSYYNSIHITGTGPGDYPFTVPVGGGAYHIGANFAGGDSSFVVHIKNEQGIYVHTVLFECVNTSGCAPTPIKNNYALVNLKAGKYFLEVLNDPPYQKKYNVAPWSIDIAPIIY